MPNWARRYITSGVSKATPIQNSSRIIRFTMLLTRINGVATSPPKVSKKWRAGGVITKYPKATPERKATSTAGRNPKR